MSKIFLTLLFLLISFTNSSDTIFVQEIKFDVSFPIHLSSSYDGYVVYGNIFNNKDTVDFHVDSPVAFDKISYFFSNGKYPTIDDIPLEFFTHVNPNVTVIEGLYRYTFQVKEYEKEFTGLYVYFVPNTPISNNQFTIYSVTSKHLSESDTTLLIIGIVVLVLIFVGYIVGAICCGKSLTDALCCLCFCLLCLCGGRR